MRIAKLRLSNASEHNALDKSMRRVALMRDARALLSEADAVAVLSGKAIEPDIAEGDVARFKRFAGELQAYTKKYGAVL